MSNETADNPKANLEKIVAGSDNREILWVDERDNSDVSKAWQESLEIHTVHSVQDAISNLLKS